MALARIGHQPEGATGEQRHVRHLHTPVDASDDQAFLALVNLKPLGLLDAVRHADARSPAVAAVPFAVETGDAAVASLVTFGFGLKSWHQLTNIQCRPIVLFQQGALFFRAGGYRLITHQFKFGEN
jgi:hypothetical protein